VTEQDQDTQLVLFTGLRITNNYRFLWTQWWTLRLLVMRGISGVKEQLLLCGRQRGVTALIVLVTLEKRSFF